MLSHLIIRNFAIIDHLEIPFHTGFTVLTGETGAGKSIIIDALNLLLGGRASNDVIRTDEEQAVVEGVFEPTGPAEQRVAHALEARGIDFDDQLIIRRIVSRNGRNKVFINGSLTTVSNLADATRDLVDISGQHEHYSLVRVDGHIDLLDAFAGLEDRRADMAGVFGEVRRLRRELKELRRDDRDRLHRIDFLRYQLEEIDKAELEPGEEDDLNADVEKLKFAERIAEAIRLASLNLHDANGAAVERIGEALGAMRSASSHDSALVEFEERLVEANTLVSELSRDIQHYGMDLESDPARLDELIERQETIKKLCRKHGATVDDIIATAEDMRSELHRLENAAEHGEELEHLLDQARQKAWRVAHRLSKARRKAASNLASAIEAQLHQLNMKGAKFRVAFHPQDLPSEEAPSRSSADAPTLEKLGFDTVEFLLSPNPGEALHPLADIASGGELSRIMLAIKSVLVGRDTISTYVFDEIDTGIGGETADIVGSKIQATADNHQVLCITHLASIASRSDHHYLVEKGQVDGRTRSTIRPLDNSERIEALAKMLGGQRATDKTREAARDLLDG